MILNNHLSRLLKTLLDLLSNQILGMDYVETTSYLEGSKPLSILERGLAVCRQAGVSLLQKLHSVINILRNLRSLLHAFIT